MESYRHWAGHAAPLTPQEERQVRGELHALADDLMARITALEGFSSSHTRSAIQASVSRREMGRAYSECISSLSLRHERREGDESYRLERQLLGVLHDARALEMPQLLRGPLGEEDTPSGFLGRMAGHPEDFVATLLTPQGNGNLGPEGSLWAAIKGLEVNLRSWHTTPSLQNREEGAALKRTHKALSVFVGNLSWSLSPGAEGTLAHVENGVDVQRSILRLLRWRLERCGDALALPQGWLLSSRALDSSVILVLTLQLLAALSEKLLVAGVSPLAVGTWDAVLEGVIDLMVRTQEQALQEGRAHSRVTVETFRGLVEEAHLFAGDLQELSAQGVGDLPGALQRPLVARALGERHAAAREALAHE